MGCNFSTTDSSKTPPTVNELYLHLHTVNHDGMTFIDIRSERFYDRLQRRRLELTQATSDQPVDDETVYLNVAGECPKGRVYGLGSLGRKKRRYADPGASTSQMPEMVTRAEFDIVAEQLRKFTLFKSCVVPCLRPILEDPSNLQIFFDYYAIAKPPISKELHEKMLNFMPSLAVISMDNYNDSSHPRLTNYDTLLENIPGLKEGKPAHAPNMILSRVVAQDTEADSSNRTIEVPSSRIVIIEGIYALSEKLRPLLDLRAKHQIRRRQELTQTTPDQPLDDEAMCYKVAGGLSPKDVSDGLE
ncbi:hypothetical protein Scep_014403 [Stephania cephalantha]|uniref:Phosphoribulokinase/uridine kinase domain-containing protein n=1 Tax=Stephania cephalantha TaxID=152367 RepID=A0AAP0NZC9_9MAGN